MAEDAEPHMHVQNQIYTPLETSIHESEPAETLRMPEPSESDPTDETSVSSRSLLGRGSRDQFTCNQCQYQADKIRHLQMHMTRCHRTKTHKCDNCGKTYQFGYLLKQHIDRKHMAEKRPSVCEQCGKTFQTEAHRRHHKRTRHDIVTPQKNKNSKFVCDVCQAVCGSKMHLQGHINGHHGLKPFRCRNCNATYAYESSLMLHEKGCGTETVHSCPTCDKRFKTEKCVKQHIAGKHNTFGHRCGVCDKVFKWKPNLATHHKKHHANVV